MAVIERLAIGPLCNGNGLFWDNKTQALFVTDLETGHIYRYDNRTRLVMKIMLDRKPAGFIIPVFMEPNYFICGQGVNLNKFKWNLNKMKAEEVELIEKVTEAGNVQINVGNCDGCGHLWTGVATTLTFQHSEGGVYNYSSCNGIIKQVADLNEPTGIAWNPQCNKMYLIDAFNSTIDCYDCDVVKGTASNKQILFDFAKNSNIKGNPYGITIDVKGNLWVTCFGGSQVININPETGSILNTIKFSTNQLTSLTFGGRYLDQLYVASSGNYFRREDRERYKDAGSIFKVSNLNVKGRSSYEFIPN